jgi:hypothetical protein
MVQGHHEEKQSEPDLWHGFGKNFVLKGPGKPQRANQHGPQKLLKMSEAVSLTSTYMLHTLRNDCNPNSSYSTLAD